MRTAEEIYNEVFNHVYVDDRLSTKDKYTIRASVKRCINEARKEAIEEAAKKTIGGSMKSENEIKESILSLIKELK